VKAAVRVPVPKTARIGSCEDGSPEVVSKLTRAGGAGENSPGFALLTPGRKLQIKEPQKGDRSNC